MIPIVNNTVELPSEFSSQCSRSRIGKSGVVSDRHCYDREAYFHLLKESSEDCGGTLCLLEDFRRADEPPTNFRSASTYTVLQSLVYFAREQLRSTVMSLHIPDEPHPNPYAKFDSKLPSLAEYHNVKDYAWQFVTNPVQLLREWGCAISPPRDVEVLYRIREFGRDSSHHWERVTIFGYPIWIREGTAQRIKNQCGDKLRPVP